MALSHGAVDVIVVFPVHTCSVGLQCEIGVFPDHTHLLLVTIGILWLILTVPWVDLRCVIVVFPVHTCSVALLLVCSMRLWYFLIILTYFL